MKKTSIILIAAVLTPAFAHAASAVLDFTTDTFTPNFNTIVSGGISGSGNFMWDNASGVFDSGGSPGGGVKTLVVADQTANYIGATFDLTTGTNIISEFVNYTAASATDVPLQLGFINNANNTFNNRPGTTFISARILGNKSAEFEFKNASGTIQLDTTIFSRAVANGSWLKLTLSLQPASLATGTFTYSFSVDDYGLGGNSASPVNLITASRGFSDIAFMGSNTTNYIAGFRTTMLESPGFDNFSVNPPPIPEPGIIALLGLGGLFMARRQRAQQL